MNTIVLDGKIPSKKNSWRRGLHGKVYIPKYVQSELDDLMWQIKSKPRKRFDKEVSVSCQFRGQDRKDLDNCVTTLLDLLQKSGVLLNDKLVSHITAWRTEGMPQVIVDIALT